MEKEKVLQIINDKIFKYLDLEEDEKAVLERYLEKVEEVLEILCQREEELLWWEGEWIISSEVEDRKQYRQFLRQVSGQEYYIPEQEEIFFYAEHMADTDNPHYQRMLKDLIRVTKDTTKADNLMFELEYMAAQNDFQTHDIMNLLFEQHVEFPSQRSEENFARNCSEWLYTLRKWSNRGFTDQELGKQREGEHVSVAPEQTFQGVQIQKQRKKVGRNDPCPCGSGKKYKRCCGK